jgi:hypothetical protein
MAGMVFVSAKTDALNLRSPHTISNFLPFGRTNTGCNMPTCLILSASSVNSLSLTDLRGLKSPVTILLNYMETIPFVPLLSVEFTFLVLMILIIK